MRVARALSMLGRASRREAERMIADGRVAVNNERVVDPATLVRLVHDQLTVDGERVGAAPRRVYLALHKPAGFVSTVRDPHAERTVMQLVPAEQRLYPVGRLDKESEGLIILTNDGELANAITHPRYEIEKEYRALVDREPARKTLERLRRGILLDGVSTAPAEISFERTEPGGVWLRLVLREGRNHEVRRMLEAIGHPVRRLIRTRIGPVQIGGLRPGTYRALSQVEVRELLLPARRAAIREKRRAARAADAAAAASGGGQQRRMPRRTARG